MNDLAALVPATVNVAFPATGDTAPASGFYRVAVTLSSLGLSSFLNIVGNPSQALLHRYEAATYPSGSTPSNATTLATLAAQVATDWYSWQTAPFDQYFVGVAEWTPEGLHDIEWTQRDGRITTHIQRGEFNPIDDLAYTFPPQLPSTYFAVSATAITARAGYVLGQGTATILTTLDNGNGTRSWTPTGTQYTVYNSCATIAAGTFLELYREPNSNVLMVYPLCSTSKYYCMCPPDIGSGSGSAETCASPSCLYLSPTELAAQLAIGWTILSGPYETSAECTAQCVSTSKWYCLDDSGVPVGTCPQSVTFSIAGMTNGGDCDGCQSSFNNIVLYEAAECSWANGLGFVSCPNEGANIVMLINLYQSGGVWNLLIQVGGSSLTALYTTSSTWDYVSPLVLNRVTAANDTWNGTGTAPQPYPTATSWCLGWPATVTVNPL